MKDWGSFVFIVAAVPLLAAVILVTTLAPGFLVSAGVIMLALSVFLIVWDPSDGGFRDDFGEIAQVMAAFALLLAGLACLGASFVF